jgi:hypothetical protein
MTPRNRSQSLRLPMRTIRVLREFGSDEVRGWYEKEIESNPSVTSGTGYQAEARSVMPFNCTYPT